LGHANAAFLKPTAISQLTKGDLERMGSYIFGSHWKTPLSLAIGVRRQRVYGWASGRIPVSRRYTTAIAQLAARTATRRIYGERVNYFSMVTELESYEARRLLATFDIAVFSVPPVPADDRSAATRR
jgi:hypothetical protein